MTQKCSNLENIFLSDSLRGFKGLSYVGGLNLLLRNRSTSDVVSLSCARVLSHLLMTKYIDLAKAKREALDNIYSLFNKI